MFSQRNNPYCELLQNCNAMIQKKININTDLRNVNHFFLIIFKINI
jgi:hypothetical protein